jgi:hypothetical protein
MDSLETIFDMDKTDADGLLSARTLSSDDSQSQAEVLNQLTIKHDEPSPDNHEISNRALFDIQKAAPRKKLWGDHLSEGTASEDGDGDWPNNRPALPYDYSLTVQSLSSLKTVKPINASDRAIPPMVTDLNDAAIKRLGRDSSHDMVLDGRVQMRTGSRFIDSTHLPGSNERPIRLDLKYTAPRVSGQNTIIDEMQALFGMEEPVTIGGRSLTSHELTKSSDDELLLAVLGVPRDAIRQRGLLSLKAVTVTYDQYQERRVTALRGTVYTKAKILDCLILTSAFIDKATFDAALPETRRYQQILHNASVSLSRLSAIDTTQILKLTLYNADYNELMIQPDNYGVIGNRMVVVLNPIKPIGIPRRYLPWFSLAEQIHRDIQKDRYEHITQGGAHIIGMSAEVASDERFNEALSEVTKYIINSGNVFIASQLASVWRMLSHVVRFGFIMKPAVNETFQRFLERNYSDENAAVLPIAFRQPFISYPVKSVPLIRHTGPSLLTVAIRLTSDQQVRQRYVNEYARALAMVKKFGLDGRGKPYDILSDAIEWGPSVVEGRVHRIASRIYRKFATEEYYGKIVGRLHAGFTNTKNTLDTYELFYGYIMANGRDILYKLVDAVSKIMVVEDQLLLKEYERSSGISIVNVQLPRLVYVLYPQLE